MAGHDRHHQLLLRRNRMLPRRPGRCCQRSRQAGSANATTTKRHRLRIRQPGGPDTPKTAATRHTHTTQRSQSKRTSLSTVRKRKRPSHEPRVHVLENAVNAISTAGATPEKRNVLELVWRLPTGTQGGKPRYLRRRANERRLP